MDYTCHYLLCVVGKRGSNELCVSLFIYWSVWLESNYIYHNQGVEKKIKEEKKDNKTFHINPKKSLKSLEILCENLINKFRFNFNCKTCHDFIGFKKRLQNFNF